MRKSIKLSIECLINRKEGTGHLVMHSHVITQKGLGGREGMRLMVCMIYLDLSHSHPLYSFERGLGDDYGARH